MTQMILPDIKGILLARKYAYDILRRFLLRNLQRNICEFFGRKCTTNFHLRKKIKTLLRGI